MYFAKMAHLLQTTKKLHPHAIFVIENPVGLLYKMPLMAELERTLGLHRVQVDYCAFGRCDKKPTHLWTNVSLLLFTVFHFIGGDDAKNSCLAFTHKSGIIYLWR